jgi:hypothetical protein
MNRPPKNQCQPASRIIAALGGVEPVRSATGKSRSTVYGWMQRAEIGGTGGVIPFRHIPALLALAKESGTALSADDFFPESQS